MCLFTQTSDADKKDQAAIRDPSLLIWPEDEVNSYKTICWNPITFLRTKWRYWTFAYMDVVLDKGAQQNKKNGHYLTSNDLYVVPKEMESIQLAEVFEKHYHIIPVQDVDQPPPSHTIDSLRASRRRLLWALWKVGASTFIPAGFCQLLVVICGTALPLLVRELLAVLEEQQQDEKSVVEKGLPLAISIFIVSVFNGFGNHRQRHLAMKTGVALRAAVMNQIYEHVLQLSPTGKKGLTSGEITNLFAVDTQKLFEVTQEGHLIWSLPLSISLVSFFLYRTLGPSTLVGIAVLVGFVPVIQVVTSKMLSIRQKRVVYTDRRVDIVSNMLQGIKVTKLNNYEG